MKKYKIPLDISKFNKKNVSSEIHKSKQHKYNTQTPLTKHHLDEWSKGIILNVYHKDFQIPQLQRFLL